MIKKILYLTFLISLSGCGIFTPRDPERPDPNTEIDFFNFSALLDGTGEKFTSFNPDELFDYALEYTDLEEQFNKQDLKDRLRQIENKYPDMQIVWVKKSVIKIGDTLRINGVSYSVTISEDGQQKVHEGKSDFDIVRSDMWRICKWRDIPSDAGKSFFAPLN